MNGHAKGTNGKAEHDSKLRSWISGANAKDEHPRPYCFFLKSKKAISPLSLMLHTILSHPPFHIIHSKKTLETTVVTDIETVIIPLPYLIWDLREKLDGNVITGLAP